MFMADRSLLDVETICVRLQLIYKLAVWARSSSIAISTKCLERAGAKVVLKTSTYPNKRKVAYGTIRSTDPRTKACGIELGAEFSLVRTYQPLLDNEELVREDSDCKTIGEAFSSGYLIAWPSAFIREKDN
ncbi:hypothetical protein D1007_37582 [Hordeum vulgare]|nr:hypothetical protein D1007_37582 [Hordeum vulgare]